MKTKWFLKILTSLVLIALVFGSASFASAKGSGNAEKKKSVPVQQQDKTAVKKVTSKKEKKKKVVIKSKRGKSLEKRVKASESTINRLTKSINKYFGVNGDGTTEKELSKKTANSKYKSYKGKLKAEINKLRAVDKQLASYKKKYKSTSAEWDALAVKSKELQKLAKDEITRVKILANEASAPKPEDGATHPTEPGTTEAAPQQN